MNNSEVPDVTLVLRDLLNLFLDRMIFFGEGSKNLEDVKRRLRLDATDPEESLRRCRNRILSILGNSSFPHDIRRLRFIIRNIEEKTRSRIPCENEWKCLGLTLDKMKRRFGTEFRIPVAEMDRGPKEDPEAGHDKPEPDDFRSDSGRRSDQ